MKDYYYIEIDNDYLYHHGVKGQKWGVRKEDDNQHKKGVHLKVTPKLVAVSGATALTASGATFLARKLAKGSFVSGGYVVTKGIQGIHYSTDVGKAVTTALLAGGIGALTVASVKTIADSTKKEE